MSFLPLIFLKNNNHQFKIFIFLEEFQPQKHWNPPKLVPKTPKLQALKRRRVVEALSREEQENKEIEEMKA